MEELPARMTASLVDSSAIFALRAWLVGMIMLAVVSAGSAGLSASADGRPSLSSLASHPWINGRAPRPIQAWGRPRPLALRAMPGAEAHARAPLARWSDYDSDQPPAWPALPFEAAPPRAGPGAWGAPSTKEPAERTRAPPSAPPRA